MRPAGLTVRGGLGALALLCAAAAIWLTLGSDHEDLPITSAALGSLIGFSFIGVGLLQWGRIGALLVTVGFTWFLAALTEANATVPFTIGVAGGSLFLGVLAHMLLAFPDGRLEGRAERAAIAVAYVVVTVGVTLPLLFDDHIDGYDGPPRDALLVTRAPGLSDALLTAVQVVGIATALAVIALLVRHWRAASPPRRRALAPVLWTGAVLLALVSVQLVVDALVDDTTTPACEALNIAVLACFLAVPYAYLGGLLRLRLVRAGAVGFLVRRLNAADTRGGLRAALADALGDPSLDLVFARQVRGGWVDAQGRCRTLPDREPGRAVTKVERDGEVIGALLHDASLAADATLLRSAAAAAALALDNERLAAELRARVVELQESREKIIEWGLGERRRLERDLHDGAQQRLIALSLQVNLARAKLDDDPATAATLLDRARDELRQALDELRELARGIHPAILTDQGLGPALDALAQRSPVPVAVGLPTERLPARVEAAAYFVISESLANVVKYAGATHAEVRIARENGHALVEVRDDGIGGADPQAGTGLRGLADRLAAVDGRLDILSPPGAGTLVRAAIPCASS